MWREKCKNINVFRSLRLFHNGEVLLGPLILDIDREQYTNDKGYIQDLGEALEDTQRIIKYLDHHYRTKNGELRVMFTGHKGFNIEVLPRTVGITSTKNQQEEFDAWLKYINNALGSNTNRKFVDSLHDHVRLHNSINKWIQYDGKEVSRCKYEVTIEQLHSLSASGIISVSEQLAGKGCRSQT